MPTHHPGPERETSALNLFIALTRAAETVQRATLRRAPLPQGVTQSQFGVLEILYHLGPLCQATVSEKVLKSKGNISVVVSHLEDRGLLRRTENPHDRRQRLLTITENGRSLIADYFPRIAAAYADTMAVLSTQEQQKLTDLCKRLGRGIQKNSQEGDS